MWVYLLRHGIADDGDGLAADDQPLSERGIELLTVAARTYAKLVIPPDRILTSPLLRAKQSAAILSQALDRPGDSALEEPSLHYSVEATAPLERLQEELLADSDAVALVGHEPQLGSLLGLLISGSDRVSIPLGKGSLAAVELSAPQSMIGKLAFSLSAKLARRL